VDNGQPPIDPRLSVERLSALERAIWSEKMKCGSNLEVALKLFLYEDVVERHLETIVRKLREAPRAANPGGDHCKPLEMGVAVPLPRR
jgi:DNA-binding NarL/FixJ family response regulator